jgi:UDP-2,4-diacetamido-2,4,6-trideoxy-beta-L-altropyranose hydrolase
MIVNGAPSAIHMGYETSDGGGLLLGPTYQCLRSPFWEVPERTLSDVVNRVLVVFGGTDTRGLASSMLEGLKNASGYEVDVIDSPRSAAEMRDAMLAADIAVTAGGQTVYELACTGTPAVAVVVAENQRRQVEELVRLGVLAVAGSWDDPEIARKAVEGVIELSSKPARERMSRAGRALVDGQGALRTARTVVALGLDKRIDLRPACPDDEHALLVLANNAAVRASSFSSGPITPQDHHQWFSARMRDPASLLLLAWDGEDLAGYVRFQLDVVRAEVSIALADDYRGCGLAGRLLARGLDALSRAHPHINEVLAQTRIENLASKRMFEQAGFVSHATGEVDAGRTAYLRRL